MTESPCTTGVNPSECGRIWGETDGPESAGNALCPALTPESAEAGMNDSNARPQTVGAEYGQLDRAELEARCAAAEAVCVMVAWSPARIDTGFDSDAATTELWQQWHRLAPASLTDPAVQRDLNEAVPRLAARRRATRQATLDRIRGLGDAS